MQSNEHVVLTTMMPRTGASRMFIECWTESVVRLASEGMLSGVVVQEAPYAIDVFVNGLCRSFLENRGGDWLMLLDSDLVWDSGQLVEFLRRATSDTPVVSGAYAFVGGGGKIENVTTATAFRTISQARTTSGPDQVAEVDGGITATLEGIEFTARDVDVDSLDGVSRVEILMGGALLLHRSALEKMSGEIGPTWFLSNGPGLHHDISFCLRAWQHDVPCFLDPAFRLHHIRPLAVPVGYNA